MQQVWLFKILLPNETDILHWRGGWVTRYVTQPNLIHDCTSCISTIFQFQQITNKVTAHTGDIVFLGDKCHRGIDITSRKDPSAYRTTCKNKTINVDCHIEKKEKNMQTKSLTFQQNPKAASDIHLLNLKANAIEASVTVWIHTSYRKC